MDSFELSERFSIVPSDQIDRFRRIRQKKIIFGIALTIAILFIILLVISIFVSIFERKSQVISLPTSSSSSTSTSSSVIPRTTPVTTVYTTQKPVCVPRQFGISAVDILYTFDCLNAIDDISQTYNGTGAVLLQTDFDNKTVQTMLPNYVTPDYSGEGAALQLNSSIPYQYISLEKSPKFVNQTFTISTWIKPNLQPSSIALLLAQVYEDANNLWIGIVDRGPRLLIYQSYIQTAFKLNNFQWQYVTYTFSQVDMSLAIRIDGLLQASGVCKNPIYGNFEIEQTTIGSGGDIYRYNGLIDQLSIAYRVKSRSDILDEATLVVYYNFENNRETNSSLFSDTGPNNIRAIGEHVTRTLGNRDTQQIYLSLNDFSLSYFQSSGFVLLASHNYTYSYALWLYITNNTSLNMPLIHIVASNETSSTASNQSICLAMLVISKTDPSNDTMQLLLYVYGSEGQSMVQSNISISQSFWYHIAVVSETNTSNLYVNGTLAGSSTTINTFEINNEQRLTLTIGNPVPESINDNSYSLMCHNGETQAISNQSMVSIDDLRFYARQLKVREIQAIINNEIDPSSYFFNDEDGFI
ncbi:unnamed protein product [Adineta steineri]|nr:unnamed protein product [Adineta steineri]